MGNNCGTQSESQITEEIRSMIEVKSKENHQSMANLNSQL